MNALKMAEIEAEEGIRSTFTVLLTGQNYNPFEKKTKDVLRKIKSYGHEIGLHFDPTSHSIHSESLLDEFVNKEAKILEDLLQSRVGMLSFHNTDEFSMSCRAERYGDLFNAYSNFFHDDVEYTSDSNGYWRFRTWEELLSERHKMIQVLTHPIWWKPGAELPPFETVVQNYLENFQNQIDDYTRLFDGQELRINKSALSKTVAGILEQNDASKLNSYSEYSPLIEALLAALKNGGEVNLDKITKDFLKQ